jgi:DNA polymerase III subunit delta'
MGFDSFLGNATGVEAVREMLRAKRLPGGLLFTGPEGVGKRMLALLAAKAAVCERLPDDTCGECAHCRRAGEMISSATEDLSRRRDMKESARRVEGLVYFDLQLIAPITRYILIEQIRVLRQIAYTQPFELPRRFFVIDQAQAIHWQAVDLLLKVIEEPPETTTFILICPNAGELRATLRSRCQRVAFSPVDESVIAEVLAQRGETPAASRPLMARMARGSVGRALDLDLTGFLTRRAPWLNYLDSVSAVLGEQANPRCDRGLQPDWQKLFESSRELSSDREHFESSLEIGYTLLRDLALLLERGERAELSHLDLTPRLKIWSGKLGLRGIEVLKDGLDQANRLQLRNVNQQLGFDALAAGLLFRERLPAG